jgi:hypothetical protein
MDQARSGRFDQAEAVRGQSTNLDLPDATFDGAEISGRISLMPELEHAPSRLHDCRGADEPGHLSSGLFRTDRGPHESNLCLYTVLQRNNDVATGGASDGCNWVVRNSVPLWVPAPSWLLRDGRVTLWPDPPIELNHSWPGLETSHSWLHGWDSARRCSQGCHLHSQDGGDTHNHRKDPSHPVPLPTSVGRCRHRV